MADTNNKITVKVNETEKGFEVIVTPDNGREPVTHFIPKEMSLDNTLAHCLMCSYWGGPCFPTCTAVG